MDIRIMQYYLTVTREGTISAAADALHVSQPALSRQMKELEEELGVTLFERGKRKITLTEEGMILRRRAEEMIHLMQMTQTEISQAKQHISGDIHIGAGESHAFHYISQTAGDLRKEYPDIRFHIVSGDTEDLMDLLDKGLLDFALIFSEFDHSLYHSISLPEEDSFGVIMRKDSPLVEKPVISIADLEGKPLIVSRAAREELFAGTHGTRLNIVATYNLIYNASLLVEDGVGYALGFDKLIQIAEDGILCFRPLIPAVKTPGTLIWKKYQVLSPAVQMFVRRFQELYEIL